MISCKIFSKLGPWSSEHEALVYRRGTARRGLSVTVLAIAAQNRNVSLQQNPEQVEVMELDGYSRPTCNKRRAFSHDALDRRTCDPQARPSTSSVDHTIDLP